MKNQNGCLVVLGIMLTATFAVILSWKPGVKVKPPVKEKVIDSLRIGDSIIIKAYKYGTGD